MTGENFVFLPWLGWNPDDAPGLGPQLFIIYYYLLFYYLMITFETLFRSHHRRNSTTELTLNYLLHIQLFIFTAVVHQREFASVRQHLQLQDHVFGRSATVHHKKQPFLVLFWCFLVWIDELIRSNYESTNLVFPNFHHDFFSVWAVEKEKKLLIVLKQI